MYLPPQHPTNTNATLENSRDTWLQYIPAACKM